MAKDHTFFVGAARVLVHNSDCEIRVDNPNLSEILSKGVHVKLTGIIKRGVVELNVVLGPDGRINFEPTFPHLYSPEQIDQARAFAQAGLSNADTVSNLIKSAEHSAAEARYSTNPRARALEPTFTALAAALKKLGQE